MHFAHEFTECIQHLTFLSLEIKFVLSHLLPTSKDFPHIILPSPQRHPCNGDTGSQILNLRKQSPSLLKRVSEVIGLGPIKLEPDPHPPAPRAQVLDDAFSGKMRNESTSIL